MSLRHLQENLATIFTKESNNTEPETDNLSETKGGTGEADIVEKERKKDIENTIMFSVPPLNFDQSLYVYLSCVIYTRIRI